MADTGINNLITEISMGNESAFRKLIGQYNEVVFRLAFRMLTDEEEAKDVVQETFIRVWQNLDKFDTTKKFSTWICQITVNLCRDKLKSPKYRNTKEYFKPEDSIILNKVAECNPEQSLLNKELGKIIRILTEKLTPKQKLVFTLSELEGLETIEISEITGLSAEKIFTWHGKRFNVKSK